MLSPFKGNLLGIVSGLLDTLLSTLDVWSYHDWCGHIWLLILGELVIRRFIGVIIAELVIGQFIGMHVVCGW